jgi:hypothetical protein
VTSHDFAVTLDDFAFQSHRPTIPIQPLTEVTRDFELIAKKKAL